MGWGAIRVWNDDVIAAKTGFPPHGHQDMEIITYVRTGAISHRDNLGNEGRTPAGDVQVMSAGTGIQHSEFNAEDEATTLFQIWILPDRAGEAPGWGQRAFPKNDRNGQFVTMASGMADDIAEGKADSPAGDAASVGDGALPIRADARVSGATVKAGETIRYALGAGRHAYLVPAVGRVRIGRVEASARDGVAISDVDAIVIEALEDSELVLVDSR